MKIFNKKGKELHIADVISDFLKKKSIEHDIFESNLVIQTFDNGEIIIREVVGIECVMLEDVETINSKIF